MIILQRQVRQSARALALITLVCVLASCAVSSSKLASNARATSPVPSKREFRGSWLPTIFRSEYMGLSRADGEALLSRRLDLLKQVGINAVIFQVRAEGDAWYQSRYEPWSRYFTGEQGVPHPEGWDPLAFVIDQAHKRGMELHAWINPYRGATNAGANLASNHPARLHPEWFVTYNNQLILNPGLPESRRYVCDVVRDLVLRYDIDALHLDDYFYPYPVAGGEFPDQKTFELYAIPAGYKPSDKAMWRRTNVNLLIHDIRQAVLSVKPWVRLGISPFGIYRNEASHPDGSKTAGLQCYDDLHADVLHWAREGWIDYVAPQVYWNIGHKIADHATLVEWWSRHIDRKKVQLYIGQDVKRTMDGGQLAGKLALSHLGADGNIYWPADELVRNYKGISEALRTEYHRTPALLPEYRPQLGHATQRPQRVEGIHLTTIDKKPSISWLTGHIEGDPETSFMYITYAFPKGVRPSVKKYQYIIKISTETYTPLVEANVHTPYTYLVTSVNRFWQESKPREIQVERVEGVVY